MKINIITIRCETLCENEFLQVTASSDFNLKVWDLGTKQEKYKLTGHTSSVNAMAYKVIFTFHACEWAEAFCESEVDQHIN